MANKKKNSLIARRATLNREFVALIDRLADEVSDRADLSGTAAVIRATHEELREVERVLFDFRDRSTGGDGPSAA